MANILIADDSASMRDMVEHTLKSAGHSVITANDGQQALSIAKDKKFEIVVTDLNMPIMDGISLVKKLRDLASYKYIPILLLTTESGSDKKNQGKEAGATGWLVKPFNPEKLISTIRRVL